MDSNKLKAMFIEEATEIIEKMDVDIINFEENPENNALLDELYRGTHTLKGSANAFGFSKLGEFVHHFEDMLSYCKNNDNNESGNNDKNISSSEIDLFLEAVDIIKAVMQIEMDGTNSLPENYASCLEAIKSFLQENSLEREDSLEQENSKSELIEVVEDFDLGAEFDNDNPIFEISLDSDIEELIKLKSQILERLDTLEEITIIGGEHEFSSSCLLQLLFSLKKTKPSINIPLIDEPSLVHKNYGKIVWIN